MTSSLETIRTLLVRDHDLPPERLGEDASLETLGIDSLGVMELLWNLEDELGITLPTDRVDLGTLGEVAAYVDELVAEQRDRAVANATTESGGPTKPDATPSTETRDPDTRARSSTNAVEAIDADPDASLAPDAGNVTDTGATSATGTPQERG